MKTFKKIIGVVILSAIVSVGLFGWSVEYGWDTVLIAVGLMVGLIGILTLAFYLITSE